jgi:hypothetical protein
MPTTASTDTSLLRLLPRVLALLALLYVLAGLAAMLWLSPKVPYADGWRLLGNLASQPFPASLWHADNGHREVLPNLVRLIELRVFAANQWLQILAGAALALATFVMLLRAMRLATAEALQVRAAICCAAIALFWLGSQRTLAHGHDAVHAYLITLCLAAGLAIVQRGDTRSMLTTVLLGIVATFSFGTGIACFAAFATVLWLQRHGARAWLLLGAGGAFAAALYLPGNAGASQLQFAPVTQAALLLRWLAAPFAYVTWPAIDPDVAAQVPTALGPSVAVPVAQAWERAFGVFETATWPWLGIGLIGVVTFVALLLRIRRRERASGIAVVGMGLAAFALATGLAITAARTTYATQLHPDQLLATRYVVWSTLFWGGLLLTAVGLSTRPRRVSLAVAVVAIVLIPSQLWMAQLAMRMRAAAERGATMVASGVIDPSAALGETVPGELIVALPSIRREHAAVYRWPEVAHLQAQVGSAAERIEATEWNITPVNDPSGTEAARITFRTETPARRLLIVDATGVARGVALRDRSHPGFWLGWVAGTASSEGWQAMRLAR